MEFDHEVDIPFLGFVYVSAETELDSLVENVLGLLWQTYVRIFALDEE